MFSPSAGRNSTVFNDLFERLTKENPSAFRCSPAPIPHNEGKPGFAEVRPVAGLQGNGDFSGHAIEKGAQRIYEDLLACHLLVVQVLEFEDDGTDLVLDRREPFLEVSEEFGREEGRVRLHAGPDYG